MKKILNEKGLLSLEACISLFLFIFLMLFMYSFFVVFEARNQIAHTTLQTANSLTLDSFENDVAGTNDEAAGVLFKLYGMGAEALNHNNYRDYSWTSTDIKTVDSNNKTVLTNEFMTIIKNRFAAYLTGNEEKDAEALLKKYHVKGGMDGLDFSDSYLDGNDIHIVVNYTLEYEYNPFDALDPSFTQSACSKLWKD